MSIIAEKPPVNPTISDGNAQVPIWRPDPRDAELSEAERDFLFDLRGFDVLHGALSPRQLAEINEFVDSKDIAAYQPGDWVGNVECHKYNGSNDGINFQNIIEGGPVFEECIDHPAWFKRVRHYIEQPGSALSIDENFLNVRQSGGFIPIHSGGANTRFTSIFRCIGGVTWAVGQINVLMALTDIGLGDGCTTVVPGSHKSSMNHPANADGGAWGRKVSGAEAVGMVQVHLKAGDALMFTDAITHGSLPRTNPGFRRVMIYRYTPHLMAKRFNYVPSEELLARLNPMQRQMVQPQPPRLRPGRTITGVRDEGPKDVGPLRD